MRILVTGAAGFIASALAMRLVEDSHDVHIVDVVEPDNPHRRRAWDAACRSEVVDLRHIAFDWLDQNWRPEAVFHLAANHGGVGYLHDHGPEAYADNTRMSLNVFKAAEAAGVDRVFFASSACAYPVEAQQVHLAPPLLLTEHILETGTPDGMYGREKLATLRLAEALREAGRLDVRVGVLNTVYGPGQTITGPRTKFPPAVVGKALASRRTGAPLELWGDGTQRRQNIYIDDALDKIVTLTLGDVYEGPVNVTGVEAVSCDEVARLALDLLDVADVPIAHVDGPTGPMARHCSNAMWERVYGSDDQAPFEESFARFVAWMESVSAKEERPCG